MAKKLPKTDSGHARRTAIAARVWIDEAGDATETVQGIIKSLVPGSERPDGEEKPGKVSRLAYDMLLSYVGVSQDLLEPVAERFLEDRSFEFVAKKHHISEKKLREVYNAVVADSVRLELLLRLARPWERAGPHLELLFTKAVEDGLRAGDFKTIELYAKIKKYIADGKGPQINILNQQNTGDEAARKKEAITANVLEVRKSIE